MLIELHIRNLALISRADLEFYTGLTVLSGETGAGKSILIDSINLALGAKAGKDVIRNGSEYAYIELLFSIDDEEKIKKIRALDIEIGDEGLLIITRKISFQRSVMRVNDEAVSVNKLKRLTGILIDMHSQDEHRSLMDPVHQLELIDLYAEDETAPLKTRIRDLLKEYDEVNLMLSDIPSAQLRLREIEILKYEIDEIEDAQLKADEEAELVSQVKKLKNASRIIEMLNRAAFILEENEFSEAAAKVREAAAYDKSLSEISSQLDESEIIMSEALHSLNAYISDFEYDGNEFERLEKRLDLVRRLQDKYSDDIDEIFNMLEEKKERLEFLENFDVKRNDLIQKKNSLRQMLDQVCMKLGKKRREAAGMLSENIIKELKDLNFMGVDFKIDFGNLKEYTKTGNDSVEFMIITNPGQPRKPLRHIASGGELSRVMLAVKTVFGGNDEADTLIFDEVDAGISGRTAQRVSEKLCIIGRKHQVICITHLPQTAAMADHHYLIAKHTDGVDTETDIEYIKDERIVNELARLLGGSRITEAVYGTAREMKTLADKFKAELDLKG